MSKVVDLAGLSRAIAKTKEWVETKLTDIDAKPMMSVTYAELVALRDNGVLIAGMQYRITDFVTTTAQENTRSAGHQFDVIVTADNKNTLNEVARACCSDFDIEKYKDAYGPTWGEKMIYIGTLEYKGKIYHHYESESQDMQMLVDFKTIIFDVDGTRNNDRKEVYPFAFRPTFAKSDEDWDTGENFGEAIAFKNYPEYFVNNANLAAWQIWYSLDNDAERFAWADTENGKGVIYRMIDEWNNDLPYDFKNIMFVRYELEAPEEYIAEGNNTLWMQQLCNNVRVMFDEGVRSFVWAGIADEDKYWEDDMAQILSHTTGENFAFFTFATDEDTDASLSGGIHDNKMLFSQTLPNNVFFGNYCNSNSFGNYCYYNSFGYYCYSNSFGNYCYSNSFGYDCNSNSFGNDCYSNSFGNGCYSNSFGNYCFYNSFGYDCNSNSFGNYCYSNSFGNYCYYNSFGNDCYSNSFGNDCYSNSFGNDCNSNSFGNDCYSNSFGDGCGFLELVRDTTRKTASVNPNNEVKVFNLADLADLLNS